MDAHTEVSRLLEKMLDLIPSNREKEAERLTDEISTIVMAYALPSANMDLFDGIQMSPMERRVAEYLYARQGRFSAPETVRTAIYFDRHGDLPTAKNLEVYIHRLRKHFEDSRFSIENSHGYGYKMVVAPGPPRMRPPKPPRQYPRRAQNNEPEPIVAKSVQDRIAHIEAMLEKVVKNGKADRQAA